MAHYAFLDNENVVTEVIVGIDENELIEGLSTEEWYANFRGQVCKRTSYNNNYRTNFAAIGYTYSYELDAFIPPKPFGSWVLNTTTCLWEAPIPQPSPNYFWDESLVNWVEAQGE